MAYGAPIDRQDRMGETALQFAAGSGFTEATSLLLKCRAEPLLISTQRSAVHGLAQAYGHKAIQNLILKALEDTGKLIDDPK